VIITQDDLSLVADRLLALRDLELLTEDELTEMLERPLDGDFRRELAATDLLFFLGFYLRHHFPKSFSPIHTDLAQELQDMLGQQGRMNGVFVMPRGFGKTTLTTLGVPAWCVCCDLRRYIMIISDSTDQANTQLENLKKELTDNERIQEDFGSLQGGTWTVGKIITSNEILVEALGAGKKIRGRKFQQFRPDLMIFDDIENDEEVLSDTQRESRKRWFYRAAMRAGWDDTKALVVGNLLHSECLLAELLNNPLWRRRRHAAVTSWSDNPKLWDRWEALLTDLSVPPDTRIAAARNYYSAHQAEMDSGAVSSWPEAFPYYDLMVMRASEGHAAFSTELQNDPYDPSSALFKKFHYFELQVRDDGKLWAVPKDGSASIPLTACAYFGFTDPSMGKDNQSDFAAIIVVAKSVDGRQFVMEAEIQRRSPDACIVRQNELGQIYPFARYGIETVQFQAFYYTESAKRARDAGVLLPLVEVSQTKNKDLRIQSLEPDINNGWILFKEHGQELLLDQLRGYGKVAHDDGPDALEGVRTLALKWRGLEAPQAFVGETVKFPMGAPSNSQKMLASVSRDVYDEYDEAVAASIEGRIYDIEAQLSDLEDEAELRHLSKQLVDLRHDLEVETSGIGRVFTPLIIRG